jgi:cobalt-zinc-cadmium efflux system protein
VDILLEGTPSHVNLVSLQDQLRGIGGVDSVHDLHVWTLTSGVLAMSCHVVMADVGANRSSVLANVQEIARERFQIDHTTVQIEEPGMTENVLASCGCHFGAWDSPR